MVCPSCSLAYDDFRTGLRFRDIFEMLWSGNPDPSTWRYKRRHTILGRWHEIKMTMWEQHKYECDPRNFMTAIDDEVPF